MEAWYTGSGLPGFSTPWSFFNMDKKSDLKTPLDKIVEESEESNSSSNSSLGSENVLNGLLNHKDKKHDPSNFNLL